MNMIYIALALVPLLVFVLMFVLVARTVQRIHEEEHAALAARDAREFSRPRRERIETNLRRRYDEQD